MASNTSIAHDFYYKGVGDGKYKSYSRLHISYDGNLARSYSTLVAAVVPTGDEKPDPRCPETGLTLLSIDNMSQSTSRHIAELAAASPFETVRVPMRFGERWLSGASLRKNFLSEFTYCRGRCSRIAYRRRIITLWGAYAALCDTKWGRDNVKCAELDALKASLVDRLADLAKAVARKKREEAARKAKAARELKERLSVDKNPEHYLDVLASVFGDDNRLGLSQEEIDLARKTLGHEAYCWVDGGDVKTSRGVRVPVREVRLAMRLWARGDDMRAYQIGRYAVVKYEGDVIQIGCHSIPRDNVMALYEVLMGKKFNREEKENA